MDAKPVAGAGFRWRWVAFLIGQRLAFGILVLLAIIFLSHMGLDLARGRSVALALADAATGSVAYLDRLALGDLGLSQAGSITALPAPVVEAVPRTLPKSLGLLGVSLFIATLTGVGLGIWAAGLRHTGWAVPILLASIAGTSLPSFFVARLLQMGVLQWARTFSFRLLPVGGFGWDQHIILPALVLAARPVAQIARVTYVSVGELLEQDFVRTAQGKGLWPRLILLRHIIPNAAIPILTTVSLTIRFSLSSLPVVEFFFGWPGVGYTLLKAISRGDDNLTVALALCLGILFILINLILEVSYRLLDPRLQDGPSSGPRGEREGPLQFGRSLLADLWDWVSHIRLPGRPTFLRARVRSSPSSGAVVPEEAIEYRTFPSWFVAWRIRLCRILRNLPLVAGSTLTVLLLILFVWGPRLAPHSPYTTQGLVSVEGALTAPPFEPSNTHPWGTDVIGRDMMSLVLAGAQQTLLLATLVVMARLVVGVLLGATAGWLSGSWLDRLLLRSVEIIAAFPALLLAMMLILALGIRQGLRPFVLGLCLVGWGEIMQFVRGQVIALRAQPFIESAVATGLRTPRIILHHILPNLMSGMISVVALEMGAVLMLLGELGFVGIFLGGGAFAETAWLGPVYHYSDVPEWGALLSNVRAYGRSYPWLAFYPSLAFFIAILTFNLFGEGVRRAVESARTEIIRLLGRYILPLLVVMTGLGIVWGRGNMGAVSTYRQQAAAFDGARALTHVRALADGALQGRALGSPGMDSAADYIAQQFEALGLQAAGEGTSYFQTRSRSYQSLDAIPQLIIEDGGPALRYRQDYVEYAGKSHILGRIRGKARYLAMGELSSRGEWAFHQALANKDYTGQILIVPSTRDLDYLELVPCGALLVIADPEDVLDRRYALPTRERPEGRDRPIFWISEATASRLLQGTNHSAEQLRRLAGELGRDEEIDLPTGTMVSIEVRGTLHEDVQVRNVIGHMPGRAASIDGAPSAEAAKMDHRLIVVSAQYDGPPQTPEGLPCPGANDNASGLAVMLEAVRVMKETGYQPYKTLLFVAYSGEGFEGGEPVARPPDVRKILQAKTGFSTSFEPEAVVELRGLGSGRGEAIAVSSGGSMRLGKLVETCARLMRVPVRKVSDPLDISIVFEDKSYKEGGQEAPTLFLSWEGWEVTSRMPSDALETISARNLEQAGRLLGLTLMTMGRETQY